jgi:hypothetical protein
MPKTPNQEEGAARKYVLTKLGAGDYLLPSNDGRTLWRISKYEELGTGARGMFSEHVWGIWKYDERVQKGVPVDTEDWSRWQMVEGPHDTRAESIKRAMEIKA